MAAEEVIKRLVTRLVGDASRYLHTIGKAKLETQKYSRDVKGYLRDAEGKFASAHEVMRYELARTSNSLKRMAIRLTYLGTRLRAISTRFLSAGRAMRRFGMSMMLRVTAPIVGFGVAAVKAFANFDDAMVKSTAIMDVTIQQTERMRKQARQLAIGGDVRASATQLAESYFFLASAGKDAEQSMALLPGVARFATAGVFDMALATDLLTDAQSALGLSSKNVAKDMRNMTGLADILVGANTLANASVQQFATALTSKAGAAFKAYNIKLEQGVALLAAYADQGIKAELAGNAADRMLRLLTKAARDNADQFRRLGIRVFDARGEFRTFQQIVGDLEMALHGMSTEQKTTTLDLLGFEARVQAVILPLLGTSKAMGRYADQLRRMGGITARVATKQMRSFSERLKQTWKRVVNLAIGIGQKLEPSVRRLLGGIDKLVSKWKGLNSETQNAYIVIAAIVALIPPFVVALGTIAFAIGGILFALSQLLTPLGLVATAVGVVTVATIKGEKTWGEMLDAVKNFAMKAPAFLGHFAENMKKLMDWIKEEWANMLVDMGASFGRTLIRGIEGVTLAVPRAIFGPDKPGAKYLSDYLGDYTRPETRPLPRFNLTPPDWMADTGKQAGAAVGTGARRGISSARAWANRVIPQSQRELQAAMQMQERMRLHAVGQSQQQWMQRGRPPGTVESTASQVSRLIEQQGKIVDALEVKGLMEKWQKEKREEPWIQEKLRVRAQDRTQAGFENREQRKLSALEEIRDIMKQEQDERDEIPKDLRLLERAGLR